MPGGKLNKRYTAEFKKQTIETMMEEKLSYRETAQRFEISGHKGKGAAVTNAFTSRRLGLYPFI